MHSTIARSFNGIRTHNIIVRPTPPSTAPNIPDEPTMLRCRRATRHATLPARPAMPACSARHTIAIIRLARYVHATCLFSFQIEDLTRLRLNTTIYDRRSITFSLPSLWQVYYEQHTISLPLSKIARHLPALPPQPCTLDRTTASTDPEERSTDQQHQHQHHHRQPGSH